jgi:hypothetical protein
MPILLSQVLQWLDEPKWLLEPQKWRIENDKKANPVWKLKTRVRTVSSLPRGLWFRAELWQHHEKTSVFQLEFDFPKVTKHCVLYRLEIAPFGTHTNFGKGPDHLEGLFIDANVTHEHSYGFYRNEDDFEFTPETPSPFADLIRTPPVDFAGGIAHVSDTLKIKNLGGILPIPKQGEMFGSK